MKILKENYVQLLLIIVFMLNGCATVYQAESAAPQAKLGVFNFNAFSNATYISMIFQDPYECTKAKVLPYHNRMAGEPSIISATDFTTIIVQHTVRYSNFVFPVSFRPKENHTYLVDTQHFLVPKGVSCTLSILDRESMIKNGKVSYVYTKVPIVERQYPIGAFGNKGGCTDSREIGKMPKVYSIEKIDDRIYPPTFVYIH